MWNSIRMSCYIVEKILVKAVGIFLHVVVVVPEVVDRGGRYFPTARPLYCGLESVTPDRNTGTNTELQHVICDACHVCSHPGLTTLRIRKHSHINWD